MTTGRIYIEINPPKPVHPTMVGQLVRSIKAQAYFGGPDAELKVTWFGHSGGAPVVKINDLSGIYYAEGFEVVKPPKTESISDWATRHATMNSIYGKLGRSLEYFGTRSAEQTYAQAWADFIKATQSSRRAEIKPLAPSSWHLWTTSELLKMTERDIARAFAIGKDVVVPRTKWAKPLNPNSYRIETDKGGKITGMVVDIECDPFTFDGKKSVSLAPGESVFSDPIYPDRMNYFATGGRVPNRRPSVMWLGDSIVGYGTNGIDINSSKETTMSIIPPLNVPAAPVEPTPEPLPPESASVQMLRKILDDRRNELKRVDMHRKVDLEEIADLEEQIAGLRKDVETYDRHIAAAHASIDETLADIAKLGGRPEETPEA